MVGGCECEHWDFATPISTIRVRASGETTDPWGSRKFSRYTVEVQFGDEVVDLSLCIRDNREERFDNPRPTRRFLKNLNRNEWEVVTETPNETVYEIPNPYYTAKLVRVPKKNHFALIANAVDIQSDGECESGGRAYLVLSMEEGDSLLEEHDDCFTPSSGGWRSRPYDYNVDIDRDPLDWVYVDETVGKEMADSTRLKKVAASER